MIMIMRGGRAKRRDVSNSYTIVAIAMIVTILLMFVSSSSSTTETIDSDEETTRMMETRRAMDSRDGDCGECPFDVFYHFERLNNGQFRRAIFQPPGGCVLAAIRDEESRRGAQYAIPPGDIALTQGYIPIEDYLEGCRFGGDGNNNVTMCFFPYQFYFENYEDSNLPTDPSVWTNLNFPIPAGAIFAAIGADGLLRPVLQTSNDIENFGYSGAVYECCPDIDDICEIDPNDT